MNSLYKLNFKILEREGERERGKKNLNNTHVHYLDHHQLGQVSGSSPGSTQLHRNFLIFLSIIGGIII